MNRTLYDFPMLGCSSIVSNVFAAMQRSVAGCSVFGTTTTQAVLRFKLHSFGNGDRDVPIRRRLSFGHAGFWSSTIRNVAIFRLLQTGLVRGHACGLEGVGQSFSASDRRKRWRTMRGRGSDSLQSGNQRLTY